MATDKYVGGPGGNWFDPLNWSSGVPVAGDIVDLLGPDGPDATGGPVSGVAIDFTGSTLTADQLGTAAAPVSIVVSGDPQTGRGSAISFSTLDGSIVVDPGQALTVSGSSIGGMTSANTIEGGVTVEAGASLTVLGVPVTGGETAPGQVTFGGNVVLDGGTLSLDAGITGTGSIEIEHGASLDLATVIPLAIEDPPIPILSTAVPISFGAGGGTLNLENVYTGLAYQGNFGQSYQGTITGFGPGDTIIDAVGNNYFDVPLTLTFGNGILSVGNGNSFAFAGTYDPADFELLQHAGSYQITYGPAALYTGDAGGSFFDARNWSTGGVPGAGTLARLYDHNMVDATSGTILSATLDISGGNVEIDDPGAYSLIAGQIGTLTDNTTINVTANSGAYGGGAITFARLDGSIDVTSGNTLFLGVATSGTTIDGSVSIDTSGNLVIAGTTGALTVDGNVSVSGTVTVQSGVVTGMGTFDIGPSGTVVIGSNLVGVSGNQHDGSSLAVSFEGGGILDLGLTSGGYAGVISNFGPGSVIVAPNLAVNGQGGAEPTPDISYANGVLTIDQFDASGQSFIQTFKFAGDYSLANFGFTFNGDVIDISESPCFAAGTLIGTSDGDRLVEDLLPGDSVDLHGGGHARVVWVGHRRQQDCDVIRVRAGALGPAPRRDLVVSTDHALFLDGVLVQAGLLVNGCSIVREQHQVVTLHHVELATHAALLAEGAPAESYLDTGNRSQFSNCTIGYDPIGAASNDPLAEVVFAGPRLDAIRERLARIFTTSVTDAGASDRLQSIEG